MGTIRNRAQGRRLRALTTTLVLAVLATLLVTGVAQAAKPGRPTAKTPNAASLVTTTQPTFKWGQAARATRYEVRVYKGSALQVKKTGIRRLSWQSNRVLTRGVAYTWKVRGRKAGVNGAWSRSLEFTVASAAKAITAFSFSSPAATGVINETLHTIAVTVPYGTNVTAMVATFTTTGASVKVGAAPQVSGTTANNFSGPVTYTVTAADASTQSYVVTVTKALNPAKAITAFSFLGLDPSVAGVISEKDHTIAVTVPAQTDPRALVATFITTGASVAVYGTAQASGKTANDFTRPLVYTVTAGDTSTQDYEVTVTVPLAIGDAYQGGKVAYILQPTDPGYSAAVQHGLIAAAFDQSDEIGWARAAYNETAVPGGTGPAIGTGSANTTAIVTQNGTTLSTYAAGLCYNLDTGGYSDWYLPSKDELNKLYLNQVAIGGFSPITGTMVYWSSSESEARKAWAQNFLDGNSLGAAGKFAGGRARAVRSF